MQYLHSYWRMAYIEAPKPPNGGKNPFTELPKGDDRAGLIVYRGKSVYIVMNRFPYNAGHLLVLPYREVPTLAELNPEERAEMMDCIIKAQALLQSALQPHAFNVGFNFGAAAGAGIPTHLHCHVVPRWNGDTNFMPVVSDTRVLPEALDNLWERLRKAVDQLDA